MISSGSVTFSALSLSANHHANGGPVAALLERAVARGANLPDTRRVIAVANGTVALQLACALHCYKSENRRFRWVTGAFTFFPPQSVRFLKVWSSTAHLTAGSS